MALSEQEQRMLAEIEKALIAEDPRLARQATKAHNESSFNFSIQSIALMMLGLLGLIGGIALAQNSLWFVSISILGFLIMFAGGLLAFGRPSTSSQKKASAPQAKLNLSASGKKGGFGDKMEDSFRRRFDR
ncbi:DUF3040 domain-containing protein [Corynebacterium sp. zg254]|uniref:DUF3040 domain-containing protein n=1 Tax=Corynebacterium zhongnanshanii TaxID=2768834 RepID=A0ABQ6VD07_9CORY|nr:MULTISPECIES: DUF3040 domain-containing protein [Corynebacterium]KAB3520825.1 DUF3040 domain-containing protein [Corynebacterium zhongnanshanii]MCR5914444.1 DUF3040 domain-containing protein [Corynebacterium sp. zg254]